MTRIGIVNGFSDTNLGGAAITRAAIVLAREIDPDGEMALVAVEAGSDFTVTKAASKEVAVLDPPLTLGSRREVVGALLSSLVLLFVPALGRFYNRTVRTLASLDYVIAKGGYVFRERNGIRGLLAGWFTMWPFLFAKRCGAISIVYSASVGPWDSAASRWLSRFALKSAHVLSPRDSDSAVRLAQEIRPKGSTMPTPDCVFGLLNDESFFGGGSQSDLRERLVLVPRGDGFMTHDPEHRRWFVEASQRLCNEFEHLEPVVVAQVLGDAEAAEELGSLLGLDDSQVVVATDPAKAMSVYETGAVGLSARMHGTIFALMAGMPTLLVDVDSGKSHPLMGDLGLGWTVVDVGVEPARLLELARRAEGEAVEQTVRDVASTAVETRSAIARTARLLKARI